MTKKRGLCIVSGILVLASLLLAQLQSPYWMILTVLCGRDMLQSGFTDWGVAHLAIDLFPTSQGVDA
jgi:hypothetical protein